MKPPLTDSNPNPEEMLEMLRFQAEIGVDECLLDEIPDQALDEDIMIEASEPEAETPLQPAAESSFQPAQPADDAKTQPAPPPPAPIWSDAADLDELRAMIEEFEGSDLKRTASNMVFADGSSDAEIMLIGEAPGADEDRQGKPFVGASGQLLDKMLASIRLDRNSVYISNILPWRPPGNRTPTPEEVAMFLPMIKRHIELIAPKMIIALGGSSAKALLDTSDGILKLRGHWKDYQIGPDAAVLMPMLPMIHPAYLLRNPEQKALAWKDLRAIYRKAQEMKLKFCADF